MLTRRKGRHARRPPRRRQPMTTARELMDRARAKLAQTPAIAEQIGATYRFELSGEGGGTWLATLKNPPKIEEADGPADCILKLAATDYVELMEGRVEAPQLFFAGKLVIEGDLGLAMKLGSLTALLV